MALVTVWLLAILPSGPLHSQDAASSQFDTQIMPILGKHGCNLGACHGAAAGRGNFKLSLFGGDASADHWSIAQAFGMRRVNPMDASESLLLLKPTGQLVHGGDQLFEPDSPDARTIENWIASGAKRGEPRRLLSVRVDPAFCNAVAGETRQFPVKVFATFEGLNEQEVTAWVRFEPQDPASLAWDEGRFSATIIRPGVHHLQARFLDRVVLCRFELCWPAKPYTEGRSTSESTRAAKEKSWIDQIIGNQLDRLNLPIGKPAASRVLARRLSLDLIGRLPTLQEVEDFLRDDATVRVERFIDRLLNSSDFDSYWTYKFCRQWSVHSFPNEPNTAERFAEWLKGQIHDRAGLDSIVREMLTSQGDSHVVGPANFSRWYSDSRAQAESITSQFMGAQLKCANCHNHPLDRWTQDDYHGLAAVFAKVRRQRVVDWNGDGFVSHPKTGEPAIAKIPGELPSVDPVSPEDFADWLCSQKNAYFARAQVNRIWKALLGGGLVEPVDDLRATNPATYPEILGKLSEEFAASSFDLRELLKQIVMTDAYQRAVDREDSPQARNLFAYPSAKALEPEVWLDAIEDTLNVFKGHGELAPRRRAIERVDRAIPNDELLTLGDCTRVNRDNCSQGDPRVIPMKHAFELIQGDILNRRLSESQAGMLAELNSGKRLSNLINELSIRSLGQSLAAEEWASLRDAEAEGVESQLSILNDFVWALLCSDRFRSSY